MSNSLQLKISERRTLLKIGDTCMVVVATLVALRIWALVDGTEFQSDFVWRNSYWIPILLGMWLGLAGANDFYNLRITASLWRSMRRMTQIIAQLLVLYLIIFFISPRDALPRLFMLYYSVLSVVMLMVWRGIMWLLVMRGFKRRVVIVGAGWAARTIVETLHTHAPDEYNVIGLIADFDPKDTLTHEVPVLGGGSRLVEIVETENIAEIVLAYGSQLPGDIFQGVMDLYERGYSILPMPLLYEDITGRVPIEHVELEDWKVVLPITSTSIFNFSDTIKRLLDIVFSIIGLVGFGLMLPFIALAIRLDSPGPIFFIQERVGQGGKPFKMIKLRSMVQDAEKYGPQWASQRDPRITRMGRLMRKTRLDELPQFINILRGEMSFVGPRAERPFFVEQLSEQIPFYRTRHVVRPGATGWAQVNYNYANSVEDTLIKLQYDLYYIRHRSLALDMLIMMRTIGKMLSMTGT